MTRNSTSSKTRAAIRQDVLDYLAENPQAQDTFEGIAEWWLLNQRIERGASAVKAALSQLVVEKKVRATRGPDGRIHYRHIPRRSEGGAQRPC